MFNSVFQKSIILITMIFSLLLTGCSTLSVSQDYDVSSPLTIQSTYQWLPENLQTGSSAAQVKQAHPFIAKRIEKAIQNHLIQRDALFVRKAPQAYISYDYSVIQTQSHMPTMRFGFGWHSHSRRRPGLDMWGVYPMNYTEITYEEALWEVDIYNALGELVWRGKTSTPVQHFDTAQEAQQDTQRIIDAILNQYPPNQNRSK